MPSDVVADDLTSLVDSITADYVLVSRSDAFVIFS